MHRQHIMQALLSKHTLVLLGSNSSASLAILQGRNCLLCFPSKEL